MILIIFKVTRVELELLSPTSSLRYYVAYDESGNDWYSVMQGLIDSESYKYYLMTDGNNRVVSLTDDPSKLPVMINNSIILATDELPNLISNDNFHLFKFSVDDNNLVINRSLAIRLLLVGLDKLLDDQSISYNEHYRILDPTDARIKLANDLLVAKVLDDPSKLINLSVLDDQLLATMISLDQLKATKLLKIIDDHLASLSRIRSTISSEINKLDDHKLMNYDLSARINELLNKEDDNNA